jgi:hypothetical protein
MTSPTDTPVKKRAGFLGTSFLPGASSIPFLPLPCSLNRLRRFWHGFLPSARRGDFTLPGLLGSEINETEMVPNHALRQTWPLHSCGNPRALWAGSLSLGY